MQRIKKDAIITFVANSRKENKEFDLDDGIFSIQYSKVLQAEEFCKTEELDYCYIGFRDHTWYVGLDTRGLSPTIKVTQTGLAKEVTENYIISIKEV